MNKLGLSFIDKIEREHYGSAHTKIYFEVLFEQIFRATFLPREGCISEIIRRSLWVSINE